MLSDAVTSAPGVTVVVQPTVPTGFPPWASVHVPNVRLSLVSVEVSAIVPPGFDAVPAALVSVTVTVIVLA
jgi:hypothetical protein